MEGGALTFAIRALQPGADAIFTFDENIPLDTKFPSDELFLASALLSANPPLPARPGDWLTQKNLPAHKWKAPRSLRSSARSNPPQTPIFHLMKIGTAKCCDLNLVKYTSAGAKYYSS